MKKYSLIFAAIFAVISILTSCSEIDDVAIQDTEQQQQGSYTYNLHLNSDAPTFDGTSTRATSSSWMSGSVIYLRFLKSGTSSTYISGKATYNGSSWSFTTTSQLQATSSNTSCSAVYVENPVSTNSSTITMSPNSVAYKGTGTYTCSSNDIYVNVTLSPVTARLRFKGNSNTKINLPGDKNDIKYISTISLSSLDITTAKTDASLTVSSNGYTPYIYGVVTNSNGNNNIYITNVSESKNYQLSTFAGAKLPIGSSGYLTVPTISNYSSLGWTPIVNYKLNVIPNQLTVISCGACSDYSCESDVYEFYADFFVASKLSGMSDEEIKYYLKNNGVYFPYNEFDYINRSAIVESGTNMMLVTLGISKDGTEGNLYKKSFTIPTNQNQPEVTISNYRIVSDNEVSWNVAMNSLCSKYHVYSFSNASENILFAAWFMEKDINDGSNEPINYTSVKQTFGSGTKLTECSTFIRGVSSAGKLSNVVNYATTTGSNNAKSRSFIDSDTKKTVNPKHYNASIVYYEELIK